MAKVYTTRNNGTPRRVVGDINVNNKNVKPDAVTAVATTGVQLEPDVLVNYEFVNVTSAAAANIVRLPVNAPVGTELILYVGANGFRILPGNGATETLNGGGANTNYVPVAANSRAVCFKDTASHWTVNQIVAAGTVTAPAAV